MTTARRRSDTEMDVRGAATVANQRRPSPPDQENQAIPCPYGLEAFTFQEMSDEYALLVFELPEIAVPPGLSPVEREVVLAVVAGQSNEEIARARGTSVNTVANQLRSIYDKLEICSRTELIRLCARLGGPE